MSYVVPTQCFKELGNKSQFIGKRNIWKVLSRNTWFLGYSSMPIISWFMVHGIFQYCTSTQIMEALLNPCCTSPKDLNKNERCIDYLIILRAMDDSDLLATNIHCFGAALAFKNDIEAKE